MLMPYSKGVLNILCHYWNTSACYVEDDLVPVFRKHVESNFQTSYQTVGEHQTEFSRAILNHWLLTPPLLLFPEPPDSLPVFFYFASSER